MGLFSKQVAGVDIGHSSVKVVGVNLGSKPIFVGCKEISMDPKYLQKEGFADIEVIAKGVREALRQAAPHPLKPKVAYSVISESLVFRKVLELPPLANHQELLNAITLEVTQYLPESPGTMEIDFQILGASPNQNFQQIMVVAVSKKIVEQYLAIFEKAKLPLQAIEPKPNAIARAMVDKDEKEIFVLVDIGSEVSTISLYHQGIIHVTGTTNTGADTLKDPEAQETTEAKKGEKMQHLVSSVAEELDHVVKFYTNRTKSQEPIKEVRLCGGGSTHVGMLEALQQLTDLKVKASESVITLPPFCDRRFTGALGCALYSLDT